MDKLAQVINISSRMENKSENFAILDDSDYEKAIDLRRIYGLSGLSDLISVDVEFIKLIFIRSNDNGQVFGFNIEVAKQIHFGINKYWRSHMKTCIQK